MLSAGCEKMRLLNSGFGVQREGVNTRPTGVSRLKVTVGDWRCAT